MLRNALAPLGSIRLDRVHFAQFGESALVIEVAYWVTGAEYGLYMDVQQAVNLAILRAFQSEGIALAYPTRTLFLHKEEPVGSA